MNINDYGYGGSHELSYAESLAGKLTQNDGRWAFFLFLGLIFGPEIVVSTALPPFRAADGIILLLLCFRFYRSSILYGGFVFSYRVRLFVVWMLLIVSLLVVSTGLNTVIGRYPFFYKDLFIPIVFLRMMLIAMITASFHWGPRQVHQFFRGLVLIACGCIFIAFAQKYSLGITRVLDRLYLASELQQELQGRDAETSRVVGTFGTSNVFSGLLVMLSAFCLAFGIHLKTIGRLVAMGLFFVLGLTLFTTTASRTGLAGFVAVSVAGVVLSLRKGSRIYAVIFLLIASAVLFFVLPAVVDSLPVHPRVKDFVYGHIGLQESLYSRHLIWKDAFAVASESPIIGVGASKTADQLTDNGYVQMYLRTGIAGVLLYGGMLLTLFVMALRSWRYTVAGWQRALLLGTLLVLVNHVLFEWTGDFFWHIRYGAVLGAFIGMMCGFSRQLIGQANCNELEYSGSDEYCSYGVLHP